MFSTARSPLVTTRQATPSDVALLAALGASTFTDTFAMDNDPRDMALYIAESFGEAIQRAELEDPRHTIFLAERNGATAGYAMLRNGPAPACVCDSDAMEIVRLYSVKRFLGGGVGATLMQRCLVEAAERGSSTIWLGVWEHNARAIGFYKRWGFVDVGAQEFMLGRDRQLDRLMVRPVAER